MDVRELKNFLKIVELGSIRRAAEVLGIAQPALGIQVRNLENDLGQQLLFRHSRGVRPTEAGSLLMAHAKIIIEDVAKAKRAFEDLDEPMGSVSIGMTPPANGMLVADFYRLSIERFPRIRLNIIEAMSATLCQKLIAGEIELACIFAKSVKGIRLEPLIQDHMVFVSTNDGKRQKREITWRDVLNKPLILPPRESGFRLMLEEAAANSGSFLNVIIETHSQSLITSLVAQGIGHSVLPSQVIQRDVTGKILRTCRVVEPAFSSQMSLAYADTRPLSRSADAIRTFLFELIKSSQ